MFLVDHLAHGGSQIVDLGIVRLVVGRGASVANKSRLQWELAINGRPERILGLSYTCARRSKRPVC